MKILLVANLLNDSGYSRAAESTLKSLYYSKVDVVARHINLTNNVRKVDSVVEKCLAKSSKDCNFFLIHSLPSFFQYDGSFDKCIGRFDYETDMLPSAWKKKCNLMNEIWVSTNESKHSVDTVEQLKVPVRAIPHATDVNRFCQNFTKMRGFVGNLKKTSKDFIFYTIGEFVARKNYEALLQAWYTSFSQKDNVQLVIKTSVPNAEPRQAQEMFKTCCDQIKDGLKLNKRYLKDPIVLTDYFPETAIDLLHHEADCFISTSHAEGQCIPARDAILFGKPVIIPNHTAFVDYKGTEGVLMASSTEVPCYGAFGQSPEIYNGMSVWHNVDILNVKYLMQYCYENQELVKSHGKSGELLRDQYSYATIGAKMLKYLT